EVVESRRMGSGSLETVPQVQPDELPGLMPDVEVIDVRGNAEWMAGHLPGVENIPVGYLEDHLDRIPRDRPVVVHCQTGWRSAVAARLLRARGISDVRNLAGGFAALRDAGLPVERESEDGVTANR